MKAVNLGGGPRGWRIVTAVVVVLMLMAAPVLGGCGDENKQADGTGSQLDDQATGTNFDQDLTPVGSASGGEVIPGYTEDKCIADMTTRYGNQDTARQVCDEIKNQYGSSSNPPPLASILPGIEKSLKVTPVDPTIPPTTTTPSDGGTGGNGWEVEITVPQSP